jgi:Flp pilus assembly pilin Flp
MLRIRAVRGTPAGASRYRERGATAVEYALMVGLLAIGVLSATSFLQNRVGKNMQYAGSAVSGLQAPRTAAANSTISVHYVGMATNHWFFTVEPNDSVDSTYVIGSFVWADGNATWWATNSANNDGPRVNINVGAAGKKEVRLYDGAVTLPNGYHPIMARLPLTVI